MMPARRAGPGLGRRRRIGHSLSGRRLHNSFGFRTGRLGARGPCCEVLGLCDDWRQVELSLGPKGGEEVSSYGEPINKLLELVCYLVQGHKVRGAGSMIRGSGAAEREKVCRHTI